MSSFDINETLQIYLPVLQDENVLKELAENSQCVMHLLTKCTTDLIKYSSLDEEQKEANIILISSVIDKTHESLHSGHWSNVKSYLRKLYFYSCFVKMLYIMYSFKLNDLIEKMLQDIQNAICLGDMALMLGQPLSNHSNIIHNLIKLLTDIYNKYSSNIFRLGYIEKAIEDKILDIFVSIDILSCPSIETFKVSYYDKRLPLVLKDCINHWPAIEKWRDLDYILQIAGNRTVPVELGSKYTDESWGQKLMTVREFINKYFINNDPNLPKAYLAQHQLFYQIQELLLDICIPDYCCVSYCDEEPDMNAWFGPKGTISPLHTDPKHNFLAQVVGVKQIVLISPEDNDYLYPYKDQMLNNTSQVDLNNVDSDKFPLFSKAKQITCTLRSGDMLYIPPKWWHHVTSLTPSFSVSFWWE